ncbi:hypothetical protein CK203_114141 [Vitis vinifera]|uniref:Reverse transcriptase RNase H-like domain-containing protein n=1 Tax=Vitis vinifera TaxID=29760 RepID=A0A438CB18_VITVI|nr:hypothetical protein CK203_114141 [Vitis vinifera]
MCLLLYKVGGGERILPLFNKEEAQEAAKEETQSSMKPCPLELKYTYLEENKSPVVISSSLTTPQEMCLLEVLKRCKKAIGWQISDLKGISPLVVHIIYTWKKKLNQFPLGESYSSGTKEVRDLWFKMKREEEVATRLTSVLERVSGHPFYCFLDGYSGIFKLKLMLKIRRRPLSHVHLEHMPTEECLLVYAMHLATFQRWSFIIVFTDHSALKYLLTKQDAKARLIRWILLLQEFNLQIRDKKGVENVVADHLSRLAIAHNSHVLPINDDFPEESLMLLEKLLDQIIRKCVPEEEQQGILNHCHESACGGHFASQKKP